MSLLTDVSIRAKILVAILPICLIGIAGLTFVSLKYRAASQSYVSFIAEDKAAAIHMARASQYFTALSYNAYQVLSYDTADPSIKKFALYYENNKAMLSKELRLVKRLVPDESTKINGFIAASNEILKLSNQAVQAALKGDAVAANALLRKADPLIAEQVGAVRVWTDAFTETVDSKSGELANDADRTSLYSLVVISILFTALLALAIFTSSRYLTTPVVRLRDRMIALAEGQTEADVPGVRRRDELGSMAKAVSVFRDNEVERERFTRENELARQAADAERSNRDAIDVANAEATKHAVATLGAALKRLADGDLLGQIETPFRADLDSLRLDYNISVQKLLATLIGVSENAQRMGRNCREISSAASELSNRTERQAASLEETASAVGEITATVQESAVRASEATGFVAQARSEAEAAGEVVTAAITAMKNIERSSQQITTIISVIDEIAFQTNLLALNAGVEASRAGDAGRGFAVVAQEVRELAQRSASAAREIKDLISSSGNQVSKGVTLVDESAKRLTKIIADVTEIDKHVAAIAIAAREQSSTLDSVNEAVASIDGETQRNAALAEESAAAGAQLTAEAGSLNVLLSQFRIENTASAETVGAEAEGKVHTLYRLGRRD